MTLAGEGVNDDGKRQAYDKWSVKQCKVFPNAQVQVWSFRARNFRDDTLLYDRKDQPVPYNPNPNIIA